MNTLSPKPFLLPADVADAMEARARRAHHSPSPAQKEAGNYRMGHIRVGGMAITVENHCGSIRRGESKDGKTWAVQMPCHYGYFRGIAGVDGDPLDVMVGPDHDSQLVFVVDQVKPGGAFDEHKVILGTKSEKEARLLYLSCFNPGWKGLGKITAMTLPQFKAWAKSEAHVAKPAEASPLGSPESLLKKSLPLWENCPVRIHVPFDLLKGDAWRKQTRVEKGKPGAGRWTHAAADSMEAELESAWQKVALGPVASSHTGFIPWRKVSLKEAAKVQQETTLDITGFTHQAHYSDLRHIFTEHGPTGAKTVGQNQLPVTAADLRRLKYVCANPDTVRVEMQSGNDWVKATKADLDDPARRSLARRLVYERRMTVGGNEEIRLVAVFSKKRRSLTLKNVYKRR